MVIPVTMNTESLTLAARDHASHAPNRRGPGMLWELSGTPAMLSACSICWGSISSRKRKAAPKPSFPATRCSGTSLVAVWWRECVPTTGL